MTKSCRTTAALAGLFAAIITTAPIAHGQEEVPGDAWSAQPASAPTDDAAPAQDVPVVTPMEPAPSAAPAPPSYQTHDRDHADDADKGDPDHPVDDASGTPPGTESRIIDHAEAGGMLGYASQLNDGPDLFGMSLGGRLGIVLPNSLYLGAQLLFHFGNSDSATYSTINYSRSVYQVQFGVEAGYDFELGPLVLRPYIGGGTNQTIIAYRTSRGFNSLVGRETDSTDPYFSGGTTLKLALSDRIYADIDGRYSLVLASDTRSAAVVMAGVGVRL